MNIRHWLHQHSLRLLAIRDTPEAIAGGVALGIFFGFTPLFGLKTLSAIFFAWLTRSNVLAAVLACTAHDLILPFMPVVYLWEYDAGYWLMSRPHHFPPSLLKMDWERQHFWRSWTTFLTVGKPLLVGSVICATPAAVISFFTARFFVIRHHRKKKHHEPEEPQDP